MNNVKLTITESMSQDSIMFGTREYFPFMAQTEKREDLQIMLSQSMLSRAGFKDATLFDELVGCTVLIGHQMDRDDRSVIDATAEERIQRVLDGEIYEATGRPYTFVLCNAASDAIKVSDLVRQDRKEFAARVKAEKEVVQDREAKREKLRLAMLKLAQRTANVAPKTETPKVEEKEPVKNPVAETVADEDPF